MRTQAGSQPQAGPARPTRPRPTWAVLVAGLAAIAPAVAHGQPVPVERHAGVYDAAHGRAVFFGGYDEANFLNDTWTLTLGDTARWDSLAPAGPLPSGRFGHSAVYDPVRDRMVVFGGWDTGGALNETWALSLGDPPAWSQILPEGTPPPARPYHSAIYDPVRDRMVVFGGEGTYNHLNDVWVLSFGDTTRWTQMVPRGTPPAGREEHSAIYDPVLDRMIVFGGWPPSNDVWSLSFTDTTWQNITPAGPGPGLHFAHTAVYDPDGDRMIVFGGYAGDKALDETWALSLAGPPVWTQLLPAGPPPSARQDHAVAFDPVRRAMLVFGGYPMSGDPTWALALDPAPAWSPFRPDIRLATTVLRPPAVTVGDTISATFPVTNAGLRALNVFDVTLPSAEFHLEGSPPPRLTWMDTRTLRVSFTPAQPRSVEDSIVIVSDDPLVPRARVTLELNALGLDFHTRVLHEPDLAPLGTAMIVVVTPDSAVRLERGTLFYREAGTATPFDSVALTPLATDFIGTIPAETVTERGVEYWVRVGNSGFTAIGPPGAPDDSVFTQQVAPAVSLTAVPRPNSGTDFLAGRSVDVDVQLPAGAVFVSGAIHYREGGTTPWASDVLATGAVPGVPVGTIPAATAGARGIEYRVEVRTLSSELRYPADTSEFAIVRTRVQGLTEPLEHPGQRYRLLSVPLDFGADFSGGVDAILTDQFGPYDQTQWRLWRYEADSLGNYEFSTARADSFKPRPGRAFWLISRNASRVDTKPVEGFSSPTGAPFPIVLANGWNQIGNPFDFPVAWSDVIRNAAMVGDPVSFDPLRGTIGDYADDPPLVLAPFEGYFVYNESSVPETLWVPPREAAVMLTDPALQVAERSQAAGAGSWSLRLEARTDRAADVANRFGVDPRASEAFDALDRRKPPIPPGPWVRLVFAHPSWSAGPGDYRADIRDPAAAGHAWEVELRSAVAGEAVTLEVPDGAVPAGTVVRVFDRETGGFADPVPGTGDADGTTPLVRCRILSYGPDHPYRITVLAGTADYVAHALDADRIVPDRLTLDPVAPNPFRTATRIRFGLPRTTPVTAEVFDIRGARVARLLDHASLQPGRHTLIWDGRNARGGGAPSGMYLLRVTAGGEIRSTRLVRVR